MIKEKALRKCRQGIKYTDGTAITLELLHNHLFETAHKYGISVAFYTDEVKYSGFGGASEPCLVMYHPEHQKDYLSFCFRIDRQGSIAFLTIDEFGESTQLGNSASKEYLSETMKHGSGSEKVGALIGAGFRSLTKGGANKKKLEEEQRWYSVISDLMDTLEN